MNDLFLPYNIALQLKEIGFDEICLNHYIDATEKFRHCPTDVARPRTPHTDAPLYDQVIEWFIEKHIVYIEPLVSDFRYDSAKTLFKVAVYAGLNEFELKNFKTRKKALNAGIEAAIKLIKEKK